MQWVWWVSIFVKIKLNALERVHRKSHCMGEKKPCTCVLCAR